MRSPLPIRICYSSIPAGYYTLVLGALFQGTITTNVGIISNLSTVPSAATNKFGTTAHPEILPSPNYANLLAKGDLSFMRFDMRWPQIEPTAGNYTFAPTTPYFIDYDVLISSLTSSNTRSSTSTTIRKASCCRMFSIRVGGGSVRSGRLGGWHSLTRKVADLPLQLVGDDLFATNAQRLAAGIEKQVANSVLIKVNQNGTLSSTAHRGKHWAPVREAFSLAPVSCIDYTPRARHMHEARSLRPKTVGWPLNGNSPWPPGVLFVR